MYIINISRSALKPSRSFPNELNDNDNSSSGVSSDQEKTNSSSSNTTTKFVTYLPVESSTPITKKTYDSESSESSFDSNGPQNEQKITTMKKMLHPKLAAIFDMPGPNQHGNYSSQTLPNKSKLKKALSTSNTSSGSSNQNSAQNSNNSERSISESLALINQHVTSLGEVNHLAQEPLVTGVLAPPPGFSDPESYSDNESLSSNGSKGFHGSHSNQQSGGNKSKVSFGKSSGTSSKPTKKHEHQHWNMTRSMEGFLDQSVQGKYLFCYKIPYRFNCSPGVLFFKMNFRVGFNSNLFSKKSIFTKKLSTVTIL